MDLKLERLWKSDVCTIGKLMVDGNHDYFSLEDIERETKVHGQTAIPKGHYLVEITYSPRFKRHMPQVMGVPGFEGVRIHPGNRAADTEGCILVGMSKGPDCIYESKKAYEALYDQIAGAIERGESITLEVA
jgi:hypothetical protein